MGERVVHMFRQVISEHLGDLSAGCMAEVEDRKGKLQERSVTVIRGTLCGYQKQNFQEDWV